MRSRSAYPLSAVERHLERQVDAAGRRLAEQRRRVDDGESHLRERERSLAAIGRSLRAAQLAPVGAEAPTFDARAALLQRAVALRLRAEHERAEDARAELAAEVERSRSALEERRGELGRLHRERDVVERHRDQWSRERRREQERRDELEREEIGRGAWFRRQRAEGGR